MATLTLFGRIEVIPGVIGWLLAGMFGGWIAALLGSTTARTALTDMLVGIAGALVVGLLVGLFVAGTMGLWLSILAAFVAAIAVPLSVRKMAGDRFSI